MHGVIAKFNCCVRYLNYCAAVLLVIEFTPSLFAQFRSDTSLVVLHASVTDKKGKCRKDLDKDAFNVYENGQAQHLKIFEHEDVPVSLGIVVDNSASMAPKRRRVEAAALAMVRESNPQDEVFIMNFNDEARIDVPFTNELYKMEQGLARIDCRGGTAMRNAVDVSLSYLHEAKKDKKVLIVITDGDDNASSLSLETLVSHAHRSDVLIYAIGLILDLDAYGTARVRRALKDLSKATGGLTVFPGSLAEVQARAIEIARDIRNQYTIGYTPTLQQLDGSYRQIRVTVDAPGKPVVRTRSGYYATPDAGTQKQRAAASIIPVTLP